jgi:hypothetical protein
MILRIDPRKKGFGPFVLLVPVPKQPNRDAVRFPIRIRYPSKI